MNFVDHKMRLAHTIIDNIWRKKKGRKEGIES